MLSKRILVELARVLLSFTLLLSSFLKAIDPVGFGIKLEEYLEAIAHIHISSSFLLLTLSVFLISFEFLLGASLAMGIYRRLSARLTFAFMLLMTGLTAYNYFFEAVSDCGCFGEAIKLSNGSTLLKNLILLPLSYFVMRSARQIRPLYTIRERLLLLIASLLCLTFFMWGNIKKLPMLDFRPYKIGYNIKERIQEEQENLQNKLLEQTEYIYEKGGVKKAFKPSALPDSTWTFVSVKQSNKLVQFKPKYNFCLLNKKNEEIQEQILNSSTLQILLFAPSWQEASQDKVDEINYLYLLSKRTGADFYAVSSSNEENCKHWLYETGAEYPMLSMDKTTIRTIIRSSPGLVIIKNGVILDKLSYQELPKRKDLAKWLNHYNQKGEISQKSNDFRLIPLIIWLIMLIFGFGRRMLRHSLAFSYLNRKR